MATGEEQPYEWLSNVPPPSPDVFQLWTDVENGLATTQTVGSASAVKCLENASQFLQSSQAARLFVEKNMETIVETLLRLDPYKLGPHEQNAVVKSLVMAMDIVALDLDIQIRRNGECRLLSTFAIVLNKTMPYYKHLISYEWLHSFGANHGEPSEIPLKMLHNFRRRDGDFRLLRTYLMQKIGPSSFHKSEYLHHILSAVADALLVQSVTEKVEADVISIGNTVIQAINLMTDGQLNKLVPGMHLSTLMQDLRCIFDRLVTIRPDKTREFYAFWRALVLRLITSEQFPLGKVVGWKMIKESIQAFANHRSPPCSFMVTNAGCAFVNGQYDYAGPYTDDGLAKSQHRPGISYRYVRKIPEGEGHGGRKLTLFRCIMRSRQKWWFLSQADAEQPGTDRDIDYYRYKCNDLDDLQTIFPPPRGWTKCRNIGVNPAPHLEASKECMPLDEESQTSQQLLAKWAIDNNIMDKLPRGNGVSATEVAEYSTALSQFQAHVLYHTANSIRNEAGAQPASGTRDSNIVVVDDDDATE